MQYIKDIINIYIYIQYKIYLYIYMYILIKFLIDVNVYKKCTIFLNNIYDNLKINIYKTKYTCNVYAS